MYSHSNEKTGVFILRRPTGDRFQMLSSVQSNSIKRLIYENYVEGFLFCRISYWVCSSDRRRRISPRQKNNLYIWERKFNGSLCCCGKFKALLRGRIPVCKDRNLRSHCYNVNDINIYLGLLSWHLWTIFPSEDTRCRFTSDHYVDWYS